MRSLASRGSAPQPLRKRSPRQAVVLWIQWTALANLECEIACRECTKRIQAQIGRAVEVQDRSIPRMCGTLPAGPARPARGRYLIRRKMLATAFAPTTTHKPRTQQALCVARRARSVEEPHARRTPPSVSSSSKCSHPSFRCTCVQDHMQQPV